MYIKHYVTIKFIIASDYNNYIYFRIDTQKLLFMVRCQYLSHLLVPIHYLHIFADYFLSRALPPFLLFFCETIIYRAVPQGIPIRGSNIPPAPIPKLKPHSYYTTVLFTEQKPLHFLPETPAFVIWLFLFFLTHFLHSLLLLLQCKKYVNQY